MPNKTIYVKTSDLALWDEIVKTGEQGISAKFAEFLRSKSPAPNQHPKIIQIAAMPGSIASGARLYVLTDDGTLLENLISVGSFWTDITPPYLRPGTAKEATNAKEAS